MRGERVGVGDGGAGGVGLRPLDLVVFVLTCALFAGARLWRLDASCLWFDEIFSVHAAAHDWRGLLDFVALDLIHPPLFYLLLKLWIAVAGGESVWWLRLFPALTAAAAVVPFLLLCRELRLRRDARRFAFLLMAADGFLIQHAQELRMYSLLLLFAACSLWLFVRFAERDAPRRGDTLALFAVNLLLVYTHYFGWLLVALELVFLIVRRRRRSKLFAATVAALVVCYSPWLWLVWRAAGAGGGGLDQNLGWAVRPRPLDIFQPFLMLHEPFRFRRNTHEPVVLRVNVVLAALLFAPALAALCWRAFVGKPDEGREAATGDGLNLRRGAGLRYTTLRLLFFATTPVVVTFLLAQILPQSVWGVRHLIIIAPAYLPLAALAVVSARPAWLAIAIKILLACWLLLAGTVWLMRRDEPPIWCAWETLARRAAESEKAGAGEVENAGGVKIYATEDLVAYHMWYALRSFGGERVRVAVVKGLPGIVEDKAFFLPRGFPEVSVMDADAAFAEERFWLAFRDADWNESHPLLQMLSARGYEIAERFEVAASGQKAFIVSLRRR
ncbi:MAG TPA: glycosyltransferase family 39 protein [Pyrinomonadaceae bacterium]|nr:glycosyltransferase family 39 protein [Pyrinomonadaceae bacterium]